jgi:hypothetical protein
MVIGFTACKKENTLPKAPQITFLSALPNSVKQGNSEDSINISFSFMDGDADLGNDRLGTVYDIFLTHSKDTALDFKTFLPEIPEEMKDPEKGFEGTATVVLNAAFFLIPDSTKNADTFRYEIYIRDRAGNESNHITTPDLYLVR